MRAQLPGVADAGGGARSSTRCPATTTPSAARWARPSATRCSSRSAASCRWPAGGRGADPRTPTAPGGRGRLPARPRRGPQRPDRPTRCCRRTGSAPGSPGARCPRPPCATGSTPQTLAELRRAGLRLHRRAVGGQRRRAHRRARDHRPGPPAAARAARPHLLWPALPPRRSSRPPSAPAGSRPTHADRGAGPRVPGPPGARPAGRRHPPGRRGLPGLDDGALLLVPDAHGRRRAALLRALPGRGCRRRSGASRGSRSRASYDRALAAPARSAVELDTEAHLPSWSSPPTRGARRPARPGARAAGRPAPGHRREARPRPCAPGCSTRAAATRSPPRCSCTRRPSATGWASCATSTATPSRTRETVLALASPWPEPADRAGIPGYAGIAELLVRCDAQEVQGLRHASLGNGQQASTRDIATGSSTVGDPADSRLTHITPWFRPWKKRPTHSQWPCGCAVSSSARAGTIAPSASRFDQDTGSDPAEAHTSMRSNGDRWTRRDATPSLPVPWSSRPRPRSSSRISAPFRGGRGRPGAWISPTCTSLAETVRLGARRPASTNTVA